MAWKGSRRAPETRQLLLDELRTRGPMPTAEAAHAVGEQDTALVRDLLNDLAAGGLVAAEGRTRGRRYRLA